MSDLKQLARELVPYLEPYLLSLRSGYVTATAYTPTMVGGTTAGTTTYTTQTGTYARIGEIVFVQLNVAWSAATGTGEARFSLPFTTAAVAARAYSWGVWTDNLTFAGAAPQVLLDQNKAYFTLYYPASNAASTVINVEAAAQVVASGWFFITP